MQHEKRATQKSGIWKQCNMKRDQPGEKDEKMKKV